MRPWLAAVLLAVPGTAAAQGTAYGPLTLCAGGYAFRADASEAANESPTGGFLIVSDRFHSLRADPDSGSEELKVTVSQVEVPGIGSVRRLDYPKQSADRRGLAETLWYDVPAHFEYLLPAVGGEAPVRLASPAFDGGEHDRGILARFAPRAAGNHCEKPKGEGGEAISWSPALTPGPATVCAGLLAIPVRAGERAQHRWRDPENDILYWRVAGSGWSIELYGGRSRKARKGPLGGLVRMGYRVAGTRFEPPGGYPRTPDNDGLIHLKSSGLTETALEDFLSRLEYVGPRDGRCRSR